MGLKWDISKLSEAVQHSECYADVCRFVGLSVKGSNYKTIKRHVERLNLDTSHFKSKDILAKERCFRHVSFRNMPRYSDDEIFVLSETPKGNVKQRLKRYKKYVCQICSLPDSWNGQPLVLQVDHINGNSCDNRLENLRFLCPNCHSQTLTFAGKSTRQKPSQVDPNWRNRDRFSIRKVPRPSEEELKLLMASEPIVAIGRRYGVSDTAVRKWAKRYELL